MRKQHDYAALLKYMMMLEEGYSVGYIANMYGVGEQRLQYIWILYQAYGTSVLHRKHYTQASGELKQQIVRDIEKNHIILYLSKRMIYKEIINYIL